VPRRALVAFIATVVLVAVPAAHACGSGNYAYAGVSSRDIVHGIGATMTSLTAPAVQNGHVAGWVGVGGRGLGPHGSSEWIQVGYSGFPGLSVGSLYYEVALPGSSPSYHEVFSSIESGAKHRVAVLEVANQDDWWRVWVDGHPIDRAYHLPGSHGAWRGTATAENWGAGVRSCNRYAYRFDQLTVAHQAGGAWNPINGVFPMHQGDNRLFLTSPSSFVARSTTVST
jgi:hypothetical protein